MLDNLNHVVVGCGSMKALQIYNHKCKRPKCQHEWSSINKRPVVCPRCKSYSWDKAKKVA